MISFGLSNEELNDLLMNDSFMCCEGGPEGDMG